jgi:kumamolisin
LWTALFAVITASTGHRLGNVLPALYGARAVGFTDVTSGDNGAYPTTRGWDPATGLGVPFGTGLCAALKTSLVLHRPQSAMTGSPQADHQGVQHELG